MPGPITSPLSAEAAPKVGAILQDTLVELIDLGLIGKQAHWNVVGPTFRSAHLQLDELVAAARTYADQVAERSSAIGCPPNGQVRDVQTGSKLEPLESGWIHTDKVIPAVVDRLGVAVKNIRQRMEQVEEYDPTSQDLLNSILHDLEEQHWMLQAATA